MNQNEQYQLKMLLIDDDPAEFEILKLQISKLEGARKISVDYCMSIDEAVGRIEAGDYGLVLLDSMLLPHSDFRETVPKLRATRYTGPIGIISNDISSAFFKDIEKYGADFRVSKQELDPDTLSFIADEFMRDNSIPA